MGKGNLQLATWGSGSIVLIDIPSLQGNLSDKIWRLAHIGPKAFRSVGYATLIWLGGISCRDAEHWGDNRCRLVLDFQWDLTNKCLCSIWIFRTQDSRNACEESGAGIIHVLVWANASKIFKDCKVMRTHNDFCWLCFCPTQFECRWLVMVCNRCCTDTLLRSAKEKQSRDGPACVFSWVSLETERLGSGQLQWRWGSQRSRWQVLQYRMWRPLNCAAPQLLMNLHPPASPTTLLMFSQDQLPDWIPISDIVLQTTIEICSCTFWFPHNCHSFPVELQFHNLCYAYERGRGMGPKNQNHPLWCSGGREGCAPAWVEHRREWVSPWHPQLDY